MADSNGLGWLKDQPVQTAEFRTARKGRQPGENPVAGHVNKSYEMGKPVTLAVTSQTAGKVARLARREANRRDWSMAIQMLTADPALESTGADAVIAQNSLKDLPDGTDVWVILSASTPAPKEAKTEETPETAPVNDATADPFAGQPVATENGTDTDTKSTGRKARGKASV